MPGAPDRRGCFALTGLGSGLYFAFGRSIATWVSDAAMCEPTCDPSHVNSGAVEFNMAACLEDRKSQKRQIVK